MHYINEYVKSERDFEVLRCQKRIKGNLKQESL